VKLGVGFQRFSEFRIATDITISLKLASDERQPSEIHFGFENIIRADSSEEFAILHKTFNQEDKRDLEIILLINSFDTGISTILMSSGSIEEENCGESKCEIIKLKSNFIDLSKK
jgi:hypothetical protein